MTEEPAVATVDEALQFCMRGNDPLIAGRDDADFGDLAGNPLVAEQLVPACRQASEGHADATARAAANVVLARAAAANGEDGGWYLRRAQQAAPDAVPVRLLVLQLGLGRLEASQEPFNDVAAQRAELAELNGLLPEPALAGLGKRLDAVEIKGDWHDPELVRLAVLGTPPSHEIEDQTRLSFMRGITTACEAFGFKPNINQSIGAVIRQFNAMSKGQWLSWQEPYTDGAALGRAFNCGGARLTTAYQRIAEPMSDDGDQVIAALTNAWNNR